MLISFIWSGDGKEETTCMDPGIFIRGVQAQLIEKSSDNVSFSPLHMGSNENYNFPRFQVGLIFSRGVQLLIPIETIELEISRGVLTPCPPPPLDQCKIKIIFKISKKKKHTTATKECLLYCQAFI